MVRIFVGTNIQMGLVVIRIRVVLTEMKQEKNDFISQ